MQLPFSKKSGLLRWKMTPGDPVECQDSNMIIFSTKRRYPGYTIIWELPYPKSKERIYKACVCWKMVSYTRTLADHNAGYRAYFSLFSIMQSSISSLTGIVFQQGKTAFQLSLNSWIYECYETEIDYKNTMEFLEKISKNFHRVMRRSTRNFNIHPPPPPPRANPGYLNFWRLDRWRKISLTTNLHDIFTSLDPEFKNPSIIHKSIDLSNGR